MEVAPTIRRLADPKAGLQQRILAARYLATVDEQAALDALISVAQDGSVTDALATEVGAAIGDILVRTGRLYEYDLALADFTGAAFSSFDDRVAERQRQAHQ